MIEQNKIILMAKLARYEKNEIRKDKRITSYFVEDYVYVNNFKTRLGITLITLFFMVLGGVQIVIENIILPQSVSELLAVYVTPYFWSWLGLIILYTIISTLVYSYRYTKANKRLMAYQKHIKELKQYEKQHTNAEGASDEI